MGILLNQFLNYVDIYVTKDSDPYSAEQLRGSS